METEVTFKYEEILEEENLQLNDLPKEIRLSINALKPNYSRYQKQPSKAMRDALIQQDIAICNQIYDWIEEREAELEAKAKAEEEAKAKAEEESKSKEQKYKFGTPEMVAAIKERVEANGGHILIPELRAIIKREPDYPYQEVFNIKLHKPYMKPFYKIV